MSNLLKYSVGIDMSSKDFHACVSVIDSGQRVTIKATHSFPNQKSGFAALRKWKQKNCRDNLPVVFVIEATGIYHEQLAWFLHGQDEYVSVVLPNKAKKYLQSLGLKSKNDSIDSKGLSRMGAEQQLRRWQPLSKTIYELRLLTRHHEALNKLLTTINNQLHCTEYSQFSDKQIITQQKKLIRLIEKQIIETTQSIEAAIAKDEQLSERRKKICTIKGVGVLTFATVVAETNGFALIENGSQLVSYAGYDVVENQSGSHTGKTKISKRGNSRIRRILHMPSLVAVQCNQSVLKNLYERVYAKSKIKMKAYVAVQKKMLLLIYTLWKKNEAYNPLYHSASGNEEPKLLFPLNNISAQKKVVLTKARTTQDELPCNESPEVLFPLEQKYKKTLK